jgi:hypothetical protein
MGQGDVSKLERRTDMYVSTFASYLQVAGADLEIRAVFPDGRAVKSRSFLKSRFKESAFLDGITNRWNHKSQGANILYMRHTNLRGGRCLHSTGRAAARD